MYQYNESESGLGVCDYKTFVYTIIRNLIEASTAPCGISMTI